MPIVSGRDVLAELRKANMEIKVIVFTGFAATKDQFSGVIDVVQKPLKIAELARRVRSPRRLTKKNPTSLMVNPLSP
jgi:DNA-binding response OmpR family regulator